jgi:hypothetical protein
MFAPLILASFLFFPQNPSAEEWKKVHGRLIQFSKEEQQGFLTLTLEKIHDLDHPLARAAKDLSEQAKALSRVSPRDPAWFDPKEYAPALKLKTKIYLPNSGGWKRLKKAFYGKNDLPSQLQPLHWDYGRNAIERPSAWEEPSTVDSMRQLWNGLIPHADVLRATLESILDDQKTMDLVADYFNHCYRDRNGKVYPGITLGDLWGSGEELEVSDAESVAFMRRILRDDAIQSPIPKRLHPGIYSIIRETYAEWRDYYQIRATLSLCFLDPHAEIPLIFANVANHFHRAWISVDHQPDAMRILLKKHGNRQAFLTEMEARKPTTPEQQEELQLKEEQRKSFRILVQQTTRESLRELGLLGMRLR